MDGGDYVRGAKRAHLADRQKNHPDRIAGGFAHKDFMFLDNNHLDADQTYPQSDFLSSRALFCFWTQSTRAFTHGQSHHVSLCAHVFRW